MAGEFHVVDIGAVERVRLEVEDHGLRVAAVQARGALDLLDRAVEGLLRHMLDGGHSLSLAVALWRSQSAWPHPLRALNEKQAIWPTSSRGR